MYVQVEQRINKEPQTIYFFALENIYNYKMILKVILPSEGHFSLLSDLYLGQAQVQNNSRHFFYKICELKSYRHIRIQSAAIFVKDKQLPSVRQEQMYWMQFLSL